MAQKALQKNNNVLFAVGGILLVAVVGVIALQVSGARDLSSFFSGRGLSIWRPSTSTSTSLPNFSRPSGGGSGSSCSATSNGVTDTQYSANGSVSCSSTSSGSSGTSSSHCTVNGVTVPC